MDEFEEPESANLIPQRTDVITPLEIIHELDDLTFGDGHGQIYNYLIYKFFDGDRHIWARSYLDDIGEVSIFGPYHSETDLTEVEAAEFFSKVVDYFQRRFFSINRFSAEFETGYQQIWRSDSQ